MDEAVKASLSKTPKGLERNHNEQFRNERKEKIAEEIVQTAGRDELGNFAPLFAHINDDVLFWVVWNDEGIDAKTHCIIIVVALMSSGITDSSLTYHLKNVKATGYPKKK